MPQEATQQGAGTPNEPEKQPAFPPPGEVGVDNPEDTIDNASESRLSPREQMLANMDEKLDAQRHDEIRQANLEAQGLESLEPLHPEDPAPAPAENPLDEFVVYEGDELMFRTKVDGKEQLIPLDRARQQLQKHEAAEVRLQQAAEEKKRLDEREVQIRQTEATLAARATESPSPLPEPSVPDVSDQSFENEAREIVSSLFTGTEDQAAEKLTEVLGKMRQAPAPQAPAIDPEQIATIAVTKAKEELRAENLEAAQATGYKQFLDEYADIAGDAALFRFADGKTETIEAEHPDWNPTQVMLEAGKQTREWVQSLKAPAPEPTPQVDRTTRKRELRPMPPTNTARHEREPEEPPETPRSVMDEIRASRGQPS